ncbi:hypothetical protein BASA50_005071 [Batrachochytrium salamandrivorans]|uniref:N-acetyltransferase domain-containing protein n=1 Tax=Batrachochytrium salamandrivorans TaxID=1357716 RepID=A0ABQ8FDV5_9FUNG|nr:hypothetical protein BASA50_005071 [Batrachochytrium salamandrivorans]
MRKNAFTALVSQETSLILVPYTPEHVPVYHDWMKSPYLREMTASEPLTLEQEYEMCDSWRTDETKCTFIVLSQSMSGNRHGPLNDMAGMIGDVNLYFNDVYDKSSAEIEIMIAEPSARHKGYGRRAVLLMMTYGIENLGVSKYTAKISLTNIPSHDLFESLGFKVVSVSEIFQEETLEYDMESLDSHPSIQGVSSGDHRGWIRFRAGQYSVKELID